MVNWAYSEIVKEHFINPKNMIDNEEDFEADGRGIIGNIKCGDQMLMLIKVDKKTNIITDCKWKTFGCASAIASTSILSEMVKGLTIEEALNIKPEDIVKELEGLPKNKVHCSVLGDQALRAAINDYIKKK